MADGLSLDDCRLAALQAVFRLTALAPGQAKLPSELLNLDLSWTDALVPGTVASTRRAAGAFNYGSEDFDSFDYWYQAACEFPDTGPVTLVFRGLAGLAEVFWNDECILQSNNMFHEHRLELESRPRTGLLSLRFHSLKAALAVRKPRPRWKTKLVEQQQLRWHRCTLLGRIPAWSPPVAAVGPYRAIEVATQASVAELISSDLHSSVEAQNGLVKIHASLQWRHAQPLLSALLWIGEESFALVLQQGQDGHYRVDGQGVIEQAELWWPHTHGTPTLYPVRLSLNYEGGSVSKDLGKTGFRALSVDTRDQGFAIRINQLPVFCRGACWTPTDIISLGTDPDNLLPTLTAVRDAGMNMLRIGGTMIYESRLFYQLCDELGIMVWQDFMFANMDYPFDDPNFLASVREEIRQFLHRTQLAPCMTVFCGSSEIEQQVAMLGLPKDLWSQSFFDHTLPELCRGQRPEIPYFTSSPTGGDLPFSIRTGISHYYGVGAYQKPLSDARRANVRFTSECLGFSNVPDPISVEKLLHDGAMSAVHPRWKQRVPRDQGAGWDFEDIRDYYLEQLFAVDSRQLRYAESDRYLALARVTSGELMKRTVAEWRRVGSSCHGALIWFLRDLWLGAGWGLIDADGRPKAAYFLAKSAMKSRALLLSDEGLDGLALHIINETQQTMTAELSIKVFRNGHVLVAAASRSIQLQAHSADSFLAHSLFSQFLDLTASYRFGPKSHDFVVATLLDSGTQERIAEDWYFPGTLPSYQQPDLDLKAFAVALEDGNYALTLTCPSFAQYVFIESSTHHVSDNYLHLQPNTPYQLLLRSNHTGQSRLQGTVQALNGTRLVKIEVRNL